MKYGNCVFWRSKRQDVIAGDTTEAELIGMSAAGNELMWLKKFCIDLAMDAKKPTLRGNNKRANLIAVNPVSRDRSKHIHVRHLRVREAVELDEITADLIGTKFMLVDGLTKVLPGHVLSDMRDKLHLVDVAPAPREPCGGVSYPSAWARMHEWLRCASGVGVTASNCCSKPHVVCNSV